MTGSDEDPFMAKLQAAKPAALFTPSAEAGKSSGGVIPGREEESWELAGSITSRDGVGIIRLSLKDFGTTYCGGLIGKGNRACLIENCDIQSHRGKCIELPDMGDYLFICGKDQESFYTEPKIPPEALEPNLERYLRDKRSVAAWETLFRSIDQQPEADRKPVEVEKLVRRIDGDKDYGRTPMKKRARFKSDTSAMEAGFPLPFKQMQGDFDPAKAGLGAEFSDQWQAVVENIELLAQVTEAVRNHLLEVAQVADDEFDGQSYTVAKLSNLVGARPPQLGTMTVFDCIRAASVEMDGLLQQLSPTRMMELEQHIKRNFPDSQLEFRNRLLNQMTTSLDPIFQLFNSLSSGPGKPGDKLGDEFARIQKEMEALKRDVASVRSVNSPQANQFGLNATFGFNSQAPPPVNNASGSIGLDVESRLQVLEDELQAVRVQLESKRVVMAGFTFRSRDEVRAWMTAEANSPGSYIYFTDAHSLMNLSSEHASSNTEVMQLQMTANKTGFGSSDEALVISGFRLELPTFFGKDGSINEASQDTRVLPGVRSFVAWDPPGGHSGAKKRLERQVGRQQGQLSDLVNYYLTPNGALVSREMVNQSARFLMSLCTWMSSQYTDLMGKGGDADNVWMFISHAVRAIFADLHQARMAGRGPFTKTTPEIEKSSAAMWGCLQAHLKMAEYLEANFSSHPRVSHILNIHLQEHAVMKHDLLAVIRRVDEIEKVADKAQSTADAAKNLAKKK